MLKSGFASDGSSSSSPNFEFTSDLGVGVKLLHKSSVLKWVLVGGLSSERSGSNGAELALNLVRVDDSGEISAGHHASVKLISTLFNTLLSVGSEDLVEVIEGILGEDDESAEVTTWGELE